MTGRPARTLLLAAAPLAVVGCVDRRFVVESNVPGAQVFVDGAPLGPAPADGRYEYTGKRVVQAVAPGYETTTQEVEFKPRWYDYPPLDLIAEIQPFRIEDVRRVRIDLIPARPVNQAELVGNADALRAKGLAMRQSVVPDTPRRPDNPAVLAPPAVGPVQPRPFQGNLFPAPMTGDPAALAPTAGPTLSPGGAQER